jgi:hypothetical protein
MMTQKDMVQRIMMTFEARELTVTNYLGRLPNKGDWKYQFGPASNKIRISYWSKSSQSIYEDVS